LPIRPKLFLTFAALCVSPLLILSLLSFRNGIANTEALVRNNLEDELIEVADHYQTLVRARKDELRTLASGPLPNYVRGAKTPETVALIDPATGSSSPGAAADAAYAARRAITNLPLAGYYANVACFDSKKHQLFLVQPLGIGSLIFRTKDFLPGVIAPDEGVWGRKNDSPRCSIVSHPVFGDVLRCSLPIFLMSEGESASPRGALVADVRLTELFSNIELGGGFSTENLRLTRRLMVLDPSGKIVYQPNGDFKNQSVASVIPGLANVVAEIAAGKDAGMEKYRSASGETWIFAYRPIEPGLSLMVARNYSLASQSVRRAGWLGIGLSILFGLAAATLLTFLYQRKTQSLDSVTRSVAAIAGGKLDQELLLRSSDDMRSLADNVNLMTEQLREQMAREAEAHQFESFIKLSALLTHDLKNAIEGLSLMVGNMERHFDNPKFRADAMRALTDATDKLRHIVSRLSHPVNTLSGEFKMPRPTDLVPLLQRVLAQNGDPVRDTHEVAVKLPSSLMAMADGERIEKVMENLMINAIEAMADQRGKLTIEAGPTDGGKVFFSISDTGVGISPEFIQQKLFRPFATSKALGVGLGLYTCREVVRANNGVIEVESKLGSGTTFRVVLASAPIR
jgi:signal transduction histidine kinase